MRLWAEALDIAHGTRMKLISNERLCRGVTACGGLARGAFYDATERPQHAAARLICQIAASAAEFPCINKGKIPVKAILAAIVIGLAAPAEADAIDQIFSARCGGILEMDTNLLNEGAREAYLALLASWILFTDALKVDPPLNAVCDENPNLTVEQAMREAIARATN